MGISQFGAGATCQYWMLLDCYL